MKTIFLALISFLGSLAASSQNKIAPKTPEEKLNEVYCSGIFKSTDGTIIDLTSSAGASAYFNILDWLEGRVAGLRVYTLRNGIRIPVIRGQQASIFIDEVEVTPATLNSIVSSDIAMIKVIKTPFLLGYHPGGAIAIYTQGDDEEDDGE